MTAPRRAKNPNRVRAMLGKRHAAGPHYRPPPGTPGNWIDDLREHPRARLHGGTTARREARRLRDHVADPAAAPIKELVTATPALPPPTVRDTFNEIVDDLVASRGGADNLSAQERILINTTAHTALQLAYVDAWIASRVTFINPKKGTVLPIVLERARMARALVAQLGLLGLDRKARDVETLDAYLASKRAAASAGATDPDPTTARPGDRRRERPNPGTQEGSPP